MKFFNTETQRSTEKKKFFLYALECRGIAEVILMITARIIRLLKGQLRTGSVEFRPRG